MACRTQNDFYEASQLHLFRSASIKLAEALAASVDGLGAGGRESRRRRAGLETNNQKNWRKNSGKKPCVA